MKKALALIAAIVMVLVAGTTIGFAEDVVNVAEGATYTYVVNQPIETNGGDPDGVKLTDGETGSVASLWNGAWVVFISNSAGTATTIRVDLGEVYSITSVAVNMLRDSASGAFLPASFKVYAGTDVDNLTEIASETYDSNEAATDIVPFEKALAAGTDARYVELRFEGNDYSWNTFYGIDEIVVNGTAKTEESSTEEPQSQEESTATSEEVSAQPVESSETSTVSPGTGDNTNSMIIVFAAFALIIAGVAVAFNRRKGEVR
jgi:hypothetical protein